MFQWFSSHDTLVIQNRLVIENSRLCFMVLRRFSAMFQNSECPCFSM